MLRGSAPARIDDKGRLKIPTDFRRLIEERYGSELFVTSLFGDSALIYPLPVWEEIEQRLAALPSTDQAKVRYLERVNYFGQQVALDVQGRIVVPQILRERAAMNGDVVVTGQLNHLVVWNHERLVKRLDGEPISQDDLRSLAEAGI
jgi:MraZ protein